MCKPPKNISPFKYNTDGQLNQKITSEGITTYSYNTQGNLTKVVTPTNTIEYILNPLDQRVAKKVVLMTQSSAVFQTTPVVPSLQMQRNLHLLNALHLWADLTTLLATLDANNNITQRYNYTDQRVPTSLTQDNQTYYLHYDQVGTLKAISDTNHNIVKEITYDTYGNILNDTNLNFKVPFGFAGGLQDQDTQLVHFGYREYDPYTGKWTTKDPIDFSGGDSNLYGYVLQDPVNRIDPEGLKWYEPTTWFNKPTLNDYLERLKKLKEYQDANGCEEKLDVMYKYCDETCPEGHIGRNQCIGAITQIYGKCEDNGRSKIKF